MASTDNITKRVSDTEDTKGQVSTQAYGGDTVRSVTSPTLSREETKQMDDVATTTEAKVGDVTESRATLGVGKVATTFEDKGVVLRFTIPLQQRNPIVRSP